MALYETTKNSLSRNKLIRQLGEVVNGTKTAGYAYLLKADADKLVAADPALVTLDATGTLNPKGEIAVAATTAGIAAFESNGPVPASTPREITPVQPFELETGVPLPEYRRGGGQSAYPVDKLEIGQAIFVANAAGVDAHKVLASVAATANRKYKSTTPQRAFSVRGNQTKKAADGVTVLTGARIWRIEPKNTTPAVASSTPATVAPTV